MSQNPFKKDDLVIIDDKDFFLHGEKGKVIYYFDVSTEVKLNRGTTVIIPFSKLKKVKKCAKKN